jgi:hypothetical protein
MPTKPAKITLRRQIALDYLTQLYDDFAETAGMIQRTDSVDFSFKKWGIIMQVSTAMHSNLHVLQEVINAAECD